MLTGCTRDILGLWLTGHHLVVSKNDVKASLKSPACKMWWLEAIQTQVAIMNRYYILHYAFVSSTIKNHFAFLFYTKRFSLFWHILVAYCWQRQLLKYESQGREWQSGATKHDPEGTVPAHAERLNSTETAQNPSQPSQGNKEFPRPDQRGKAALEYDPKLRHTCMHTAVCAAMCTGKTGAGEEATRLKQKR